MEQIIFFNKEGISKKFFKSKKHGDDKLVVALVLIAIGVVLCIVYKNSVTTVITTALSDLQSKINSIFTNAGN